MHRERICPKCGNNIARVVESDVATIDSLGIASDTGAICFCCPNCHVILGVAPSLDWLETELANIPVAVDQLRQLHASLSNQPKSP